MGLNEILLVLAALLPAVILCVYVFKKDRAEKEPVSLLLCLMGLGAAVCIPAATVENGLLGALGALFGDPTPAEGEPITLGFRLYAFVENFFCVALVEEGFKFLVLVLVTRKNRHFNSLFDGIIYSVFVSLGFAALENVLYVLQFGWMNALIRGVLSVPGHMFFAVFMGWYYSLWHMADLAAGQEEGLKQAGLIPPNAVPFSGSRFLVQSLAVPVLIHGLYDYCCTIPTFTATVLLYGLMICLYVHCFRTIGKVSRADMDDVSYTNSMILLKYPFLASVFRPAPPRWRP